MTKKPEIYVCTNLRVSGRSCSGHAKGQCGADVLKALRAQVAVKKGEIVVRESVCMGFCAKGPNLKVMGGDFHHGVKPADAALIIAEALKITPPKP